MGCGYDGFIANLSPSGSALNYSTYVGGSGVDSVFGAAADSSGSVYVMGMTQSHDFPVENPFQARSGGGNADLFITRIISGPIISSAAISGKKLFVFGSGFDQGAKVLIDGHAQKTVNDEANPTGLLIANKGGKKIGRDLTVILQVRNSDGALSPQLSFTRPAQ